MAPLYPKAIHSDETTSCINRRDFLRFALTGAAVLAAPGFYGAADMAWARANGLVAGRMPVQPGMPCTDGDPASYTAFSADRAGMFLLFSDVHFDPFADPAKVKALAAASASEWRGILADTTAISTYGQDSNNALFQAFLDDMAARAPSPDFILFPGDLLCHRFWARYQQLAGDSTREGLLAFIAKTAEYFLAEVTRRFPRSPLYLALGNNDSLEGDYHITPDSPYLSVTAPIIAERALKNEASRTDFLDSYPKLGCYSLPLQGPGNGRLIVINNIFWTSKSPHQNAARQVRDFLERELTGSSRRGEKVWLMAHVPPGDNSKSSASKYLKKGKDVYAPLLSGDWSDDLGRLLVSHAGTVRASFCGHVHRDEFRLVYPAGQSELPAASLRLGPSISPITGNNPGYQVYSYDRQSLELLDMTVNYLDLGTPRPAWNEEYTYSRTYGRGLRSAKDWQEMYLELSTCPDRRKAFEAAFDLRSSHIDEVNERTFPIFRDALGLTVR